MYLTTHIIQKRQTAMLLEGINPAIRARKRLYTHALDRAATGICINIGLMKLD